MHWWTVKTLSYRYDRDCDAAVFRWNIKARPCIIQFPVDMDEILQKIVDVRDGAEYILLQDIMFTLHWIFYTCTNGLKEIPRRNPYNAGYIATML